MQFPHGFLGSYVGYVLSRTLKMQRCLKVMILKAIRFPALPIMSSRTLWQVQFAGVLLIICLYMSESLDKLNAVPCNNGHNLSCSSGIPSILYIWPANDSCRIKLHFCFPVLPLYIFLTLQFIKQTEMEHLAEIFCSITCKSGPCKLAHSTSPRRRLFHFSSPNNWLKPPFQKSVSDDSCTVD